MDPVRVFRTESLWRTEWEAEESHDRKGDIGRFREAASSVANSLKGHRFRLFQNGGTPLLLRFTADLREEILFTPAPQMSSRPGMPFGVSVYLSSPEIGRIRSRYWRPAIRAPQVIGSGDAALLGLPPHHSIYYANGDGVANRISELLIESVLPWFRMFHWPEELRARLHEANVAMVDESTAVELILAYFDPYEARKYLRSRDLESSPLSTKIPEISGYDLNSSRINPLREYYKLGY